MKHIIVYFDAATNSTPEETEEYAVYRVDEERNKMQCFYQVMRGTTEHFKPGNIWWTADLDKLDAPYKELTEEEVFALCL